MPSPQTGVFVCKLLAHPPLLLASLPPVSCLSQAFVAQMKDALPQYVSLTTPCPPSATWTRFSTESCWNLTFSSNWENSDYNLLGNLTLAEVTSSPWHPKLLQILNVHFYIFSFISGSEPILTADICLDVIFVFLSIIICIWICFSKSICICIPRQGTNDSVLAVDHPRPPGRHSRRHYWDAIVQPPALCCAYNQRPWTCWRDHMIEILAHYVFLCMSNH